MIELLGLPPLATTHGADVDKLIFYLHLLMGVLFVGWMAYFAYVVFRFRASKNPKANYTGVTSHASSYVEIGVAIAEGVLLIGFAVPLWAKAVDAFPDAKTSTEIRVIASQFSWSAQYPGTDGSFGNQDIKQLATDNPWGYVKNDEAWKDNFSGNVNEVVVPVNKPVIAHLTSKDVIHSFKVNPFRVTQDAIPGLSIPVWFTPTKEGQYLINCAQLCGNSHAFMKGYVNVLGQAKYDQWVAARPKDGAGGATGFE